MTKLKFSTNLGQFSVLLNDEKAPITCKNFLEYVKTGSYNNVIFHRVIKGFMTQAGTMNLDGTERTCNLPIQNEANNGLLNEKYTIAMARTNDPHSAAAQFFINTGYNRALDYSADTVQGWGYCVFGKVIEGTEVIDAIESIPTRVYGQHANMPIVGLVILNVSVVEVPAPLPLF